MTPLHKRPTVRVLFVRIATNPLDVRPHLDGPAEIIETRHVEHAVRALGHATPHIVVADDRLPAWDLSVLRGRLNEVETPLVLVDASAHPSELAMLIDARMPRQHPPRL